MTRSSTSVAPAFRGRFVTPDAPDFEDAVLGRIFNGRRPADRRPEAVLFAADEADVRAGVQFAAQRGWQVAVRSGGHSWASWSVRDGALLIDLAAFTAMDYDDATGVVAVGPAVKGGPAAASSAAGTARALASAVSCCRVARAGTHADGDGLRRAWSPST
jgi:FAD/FMN-containing dehydrogenase